MKILFFFPLLYLAFINAKGASFIDCRSLQLRNEVRRIINPNISGNRRSADLVLCKIDMTNPQNIQLEVQVHARSHHQLKAKVGPVKMTKTLYNLGATTTLLFRVDLKNHCHLSLKGESTKFHAKKISGAALRLFLELNRGPLQKKLRSAIITELDKKNPSVQKICKEIN